MVWFGLVGGEECGLLTQRRMLGLSFYCVTGPEGCFGSQRVIIIIIVVVVMLDQSTILQI